MAMKTGVVVMDMPEDSHDPIVYPAALIKDSAQPEAAAKFFDFLQTDYAKGVFEKYGFTVL
jgi:molybdate transport system substrate-binding protein